MHSPEVLVFSIKSPFWHTFKFGGGRKQHFHNSLINVWHMEPNGADALSICKNKVYDEDGKFVRWSNAWKWHFWHYKVSPSFIYGWRRQLLTRCNVCGGRSTKKNPVNCTSSWSSPKTPIWKGETHLYHRDCMPISRTTSR